MFDEMQPLCLAASVLVDSVPVLVLPVPSISALFPINSTTFS